MQILSAFAHHLLAFMLFGSLIVQYVLMRSDWTLSNSRLLQKADMLYGAAAVALLLVGSARMMLYEKGIAYYMSSVPFLIKLSAFLLVGLLSIVPTREYLSWRSKTRSGQLPELSPQRRRLITRILAIEMAGIAIIILMAVLAAKGVAL